MTDSVLAPFRRNGWRVAKFLLIWEHFRTWTAETLCQVTTKTQLDWKLAKPSRNRPRWTAWLVDVCSEASFTQKTNKKIHLASAAQTTTGRINPLTPTVAIWVHLYSILSETGLSWAPECPDVKNYKPGLAQDTLTTVGVKGLKEK